MLGVGTESPADGPLLNKFQLCLPLCLHMSMTVCIDDGHDASHKVAGLLKTQECPVFNPSPASFGVGGATELISEDA